MNVDSSDAGLSELERQLCARHGRERAAELRSRVLGAVLAELKAERVVRRGGAAWPYAAMAACLLLGLGLTQAASITSLMPASAGRQEKAVVSVATLRRLCPELSEADARSLSLFVSLPRNAVAMPLPQSEPLPVVADVDAGNVLRGESK